MEFIADLDELLVVLPRLLLIVDEVISLTRREGGRSFSGTSRLWGKQHRSYTKILYL
jgi:hypothetical protein